MEIDEDVQKVDPGAYNISSETEFYGDPKQDFTKAVPKTTVGDGPIMRDYMEGGVDEGDDGVTVIAKTPKGKTVQVRKRKEGLGYIIEFKEGGELPKEFSGIWTSYHLAEEPARQYVADKWDTHIRQQENAETDSNKTV